MTGPNVYANSQTWVGCARETTRGTPAASPTFWVPAVILSPRLQSVITPLEDVGDRGQMTDVWDVVGGPKWEKFTFKCMVHVDILPHLLRSILGSPDTIASGPNGSTYHSFSLLNNDGLADQPPSYTWFDYDGLHLRTMRGGQTDNVQIIWQKDGLVEVTARILGYQTAVTTTSINPVMPNVQPLATWDCTTAFNAVTTGAPIKGILNFDRKVQVIKTLGQQTPYSVFAGTLSVRGSMSFINQTDSELNTFLAYGAVPINLSFAQAGAVSEGFVIDMSSVKSEVGFQERGVEGLINTSLDFVPLPNPTDATAGGYSPVKAIVQNFTSSAY